MYENQCGSCENFKDKRETSKNYDQKYYEKGYCTWYRAFYYPDEPCCSHYEQVSENSDTSCYITTIIREKMGFADNCYELEVFRFFRNNVLQKDEKYAPLLYEYDSIGAKLSSCLSLEDNDIIKRIFSMFISPIISFIEDRNNSKAISKYIEMTEFLKDSYNITFNEEMPKKYNYKIGGHGIKI